jgi:hypothetical protein
MAGAVLQEGMHTLKQLDVTQSSQATQGRWRGGGAGAAAAAWRAYRHSSQVISNLHVLLQLLWLLLQVLSLRQAGCFCGWLAMQLLAVLMSDE